MKPILVSCEPPFRSNWQKKHWSSGGHDPHWTTDKKYKFSFLLCAGSLSVHINFSFTHNIDDELSIGGEEAADGQPQVVVDRQVGDQPGQGQEHR